MSPSWCQVYNPPSPKTPLAKNRFRNSARELVKIRTDSPGFEIQYSSAFDGFISIFQKSQYIMYSAKAKQLDLISDRRSAISSIGINSKEVFRDPF